MISSDSVFNVAQLFNNKYWKDWGVQGVVLNALLKTIVLAAIQGEYEVIFQPDAPMSQEILEYLTDELQYEVDLQGFTYKIRWR